MVAHHPPAIEGKVEQKKERTEKERTENSVVKVAIPPMTVITKNGPATTMPGTGTGLVV